MVNDPARSHSVFFLSGSISYRQKSLYCMHIGVQSPIVIQYREFCIPGITGKSFFLIPEPKIIELQGIL